MRLSLLQWGLSFFLCFLCATSARFSLESTPGATRGIQELRLDLVAASVAQRTSIFSRVRTSTKIQQPACKVTNSVDSHFELRGGGKTVSATPQHSPLTIFFRVIRDSRRDLVAAAVARSTSIFTMYPVDTIKVRRTYSHRLWTPHRTKTFFLTHTRLFRERRLACKWNRKMPFG
jgi:hypothetical protein